MSSIHDPVIKILFALGGDAWKSALILSKMVSKEIRYFHADGLKPKIVKATCTGDQASLNPFFKFTCAKI